MLSANIEGNIETIVPNGTVPPSSCTLLNLTKPVLSSEIAILLGVAPAFPICNLLLIITGELKTVSVLNLAPPLSEIISLSVDADPRKAVNAAL